MTKLGRYFEENFLVQRQVARRCGINEKTLAKAISGEFCSPKTKHKVKQELDIDDSYFEIVVGKEKKISKETDLDERVTKCERAIIRLGEQL